MADNVTKFLSTRTQVGTLNYLDSPKAFLLAAIEQEDQVAIEGLSFAKQLTDRLIMVNPLHRFSQQGCDRELNQTGDLLFRWDRDRVSHDQGVDRSVPQPFNRWPA